MNNNKTNNIILRQTATIFLIRMCSSAAFAVFFSGLSLYLTKQKHFSIMMATTLTGLFLSLNYFLPLVGGIIAKNFNSYKKLYCIANIFSITGCLFLANGNYLYLGLAFILINSLLSNVCIKMFVTNLFREEQTKERKAAFLWSYVGMNAGFLIGFFITGYYFITNNISILFYIMGALFFISFSLAITFIKESGKDKIGFQKFVMLLAIILGLTFLINVSLVNAIATQKILSMLSLLLLFSIAVYGYSLIEKIERPNFLKFIGYSLLNIFFWSIYMLIPIAFMQLIENGVNRNIGNYEIATQWFVNIESIAILILAPISALIIKRINLNNSTYYIIGFSMTCISLMTLLVGLYTTVNFKIPAIAMLSYLIFLAIAEIYVSPVGDSLVGELVPKKLRTIMIGFLSLNMGIGVIISTNISNTLLIPYLNKNGIFGSNMINIQQNIICIAIALFLIVMILLLNKFIKKLKINVRTTKEYKYE